ncbi:MAG: serine hydrolase [Bacteroidales bacterium]|nr:serine hydrolase [Bacteroidales bacterium]
MNRAFLAVCFFIFFLAPGTSELFAQGLKGQNPSAQSWADSVYNSLNLEQRIAQLIFVRANYSGKPYLNAVDEYIEKYNIGGITFFAAEPLEQAVQTNKWNTKAKTPLFISIDAEWGLGMRLKNTQKYPLQMTLGALQNDSILYTMGREVGRQCKRMGIQMNFAPVVDVNSNPLNPVIGMRSFGEVPATVARKGYFYMQGMQDEGVIATAKHFPGHGDTYQDSHKTLPQVKRSKKGLRKTELLPFQFLIDKGVAAIMVAHLSVPALDKRKNHPSTLSKKIVTKLLKDKMGFGGLIITDALDMKGVTKYYNKGDVALEAFKAGNDVLLIPDDIPASIASIKSALLNGKIEMSRLEESCKKILRYKYLSGAWKRQPVDTASLLADLNQRQYERTSGNLFGEVVTVLKNSSNIIPISFPDTLNPAVIILGTMEETPFEKVFTDFMPLPVFHLPHDAGVDEKQSVLNHLDDFNLLFVAVVNTNILAAKKFGVAEGDIQFIEHLARSKHLVLDLFASPYSLDFFSSADLFDAIIISYQDKPVAQRISAEIILGMHASNGRLPVSAGGFLAGTGHSTPKSRLTYGKPLDLGIDTAFLRKVDSIATNGIELGAYPGCQILAAKDGVVFYDKAFGFHTYDSIKKVRETDVYDLASLTKILSTTLALMKLSDDGKINIDGRLSDYLLSVRGTNKEQLGFREILTHQAGLQNWIPYYRSTIVKDFWDTAYYRPVISEEFPVRVAENMYIRENYNYEIYRKILDSPLGEKKYTYSDLGFYLMMEMTQQLANSPFDKYIYTQFYEPMGLMNLRYKPRRFFSLYRIVPTEKDLEFRHQQLLGDVHDQGAAMMGGVSGHAGLFGDAYDVAVVMQMLLNGGNYGGRNFIRKETVAEFTTVQFPENDNRRGLGFDKPMLEFEEHRSNCKSASSSSFGHSGFTGTYTWADPENGLVYVFLSNRVYPDMYNAKIMELDIRTNIHQLFYDAIGK